MDARGPIPPTAELIRRVCEGQHALVELLQHYRPRLVQIGEMELNPAESVRANASDIAQQAYLEVLKRLGGYFTGASDEEFIAWLSEIYRNALRNRRRDDGRLCRDRDRETPLPDNSQHAMLADSGPSPSRAVRGKEMDERVAALLQQLNLGDRLLMRLRFWLEWPPGEIARVIGDATSDQVRSHIARLLREKATELAEFDPHQT